MNKQQQELWCQEYLSAESLLERFEFKYGYALKRRKKTKPIARGYDGLSVEHINHRKEEIFDSMHEKIQNQTFRFTPYKEVLIPKDRLQPPRLVSVASIRDRVLLTQLNKFLMALYEVELNASQARLRVKETVKFVENQFDASHWVYRGDLKRFYDSIPHEGLMNVLRQRIHSKMILKLLERVLLTPTLPLNTTKSEHTNYRPTEGVPQGLPISASLAWIYMSAVDDVVRKAHPDVFYSRYVDDMLLMGPRHRVFEAYKTLQMETTIAGLELHTKDEKVSFAPIQQPFQYLGYVFDLPEKITVRASSVEKLRARIKAKFSSLEKLKADNFYNKINGSLESFVGSINEEMSAHGITDKGNRELTWVSYFNQINDVHLLFELDAFVRKQFETCSFCNYEVPEGLHSFVRAYYISKYGAQSKASIESDSVVGAYGF